MTDDPIQEELEQINAEFSVKEDKAERALKDIQKQLDLLEAEKKSRLEQIETKRIQHWIDARFHIPDTINREQIEHKIHELYKSQGWKHPDYVIYCSAPAYFSRFGVSVFSNTTPNTVSGRIHILNTILCESSTPNERFRRDPYSEVMSVNRVLHLVPKIHEISGALELNDLVKDIVDLVPRIDVPVVLEKPYEFHVNLNNQLHRVDGPAIHWRDGTRQYFFNGVGVTRDFIQGEVTLAKIRSERNMERKRVLLDRYGEERYLKDSKAKLEAKSKEGKLWRIPGRLRHNGWGRPTTVPSELYVQVTNATAEPDGSHKTFLIRVPPNMRTAKQAIAWTFGKEGQDYKPKVET